MPLKIVDLGKQFRPATSIVYPPFKNGRYMEEYFYDYVIQHKDDIETDLVYISIFWTNIQTHPGFNNMKNGLNVLLKKAIDTYPSDTRFFTVVQHDDGPQLQLPKDTVIFGACTGTIPLPLIYEDKTDKLLNTPRLPRKTVVASFVGTITHPVRNILFTLFGRKKEMNFMINDKWTNNVQENQAKTFIDYTLKSKFCLAPRGYGRSSFRFFEAMLLDTVPVYFWDDIEWLPYKDVLDYSKFAVSIKNGDISKTYEILKGISDEQYVAMVEEIKRVRHYFTLEGMSEYVVQKIKSV
jgi:hypothetical protein